MKFAHLYLVLTLFGGCSPAADTAPAKASNTPAETNRAPFEADNVQWGDVTMSFTYDGTPPAAKSITPVNEECKSEPPLTDETWIVDPKSGGVKNVVVCLVAENNVKLPIHPDFEKAKGSSVRI